MKKSHKKRIWIFYDGSCGLCHFFIRFTLRKKAKGQIFFFSPLEGKHFTALKEKRNIPPLPDSIVVYEEIKDNFLVQSEAIIFILTFFRWPWKAFAFILKAIPRSIVNFFYRFVAKTRRKWFRKPKTSCPVIRPEWKKFFLE